MIRRHSVPEMDLLLGKKFPVLDDGFIVVLDYMGGDQTVDESARISYGAGTRKVSSIRRLIRTLMRDRHTSPFEQAELRIHIRVPMDAWRQWVRHRMASPNEYSTRYSVAIDSAQKTAPGEWRSQSKDSKQGSGDYLDLVTGTELSHAEAELQAQARQVYEHRLKAGVAREQARKDLPLSTYTEVIWKVDLHNLLHFIGLRSAPDAQLEIRAFSDVLLHDVLRVWCPLVYEAFLDYRVNATYLSRWETDMIAACTVGTHKAREDAWAQLVERERIALRKKAAKLGVTIPGYLTDDYGLADGSN